MEQDGSESLPQSTKLSLSFLPFPALKLRSDQIQVHSIRVWTQTTFIHINYTKGWAHRVSKEQILSTFYETLNISVQCVNTSPTVGVPFMNIIVDLYSNIFRLTWEPNQTASIGQGENPHCEGGRSKKLCKAQHACWQTTGCCDVVLLISFPTACGDTFLKKEKNHNFIKEFNETIVFAFKEKSYPDNLPGILCIILRKFQF